jgi:hypothetical protein
LSSDITRTCILEVSSLDRPTKRTFESGTPIAGVFAGTQYATATVSFRDNQPIDAKKHITSHDVKYAILINTTKIKLFDLTLENASASKAWSNVCQMMIKREKEPSLLAFQSMKNFLVGFGKRYWITWPTNWWVSECWTFEFDVGKDIPLGGRLKDQVV